MEQMQFIRKLPEPMEIKQEIPLKEEFRKLKEKRDQEIADIMTGKDDRFLLISDPALQIMSRLYWTTAAVWLRWRTK